MTERRDTAWTRTRRWRPRGPGRDLLTKTPALTIAFRSTDGKQTHDEITVSR